ncbi:MAG: isoleucine--tRNA ligase [Fimbriimonadaceae bacterium]|nr:isoleucine--tRNA ligase [Fimbriimonadaceae bacterium]
MDLKSTLHLPDPNFTIPMKADLPQREPEIQARWAQMEIYHRIQEARKDAPSFVLHDGPPYTNGPIHVGTAMNKILKDFVVKSRTLLGYRAPYVPGYDNHGLPIEQAVMREFHERKENPDITTLRKACRAHAVKYLDIQTAQFKRLGVFGLWEKPYTTMGFKYEAEIVRVFKRLVEGGFIYRGLRPTLWSPTSRTALADTEIVYNDHTSKAIYVRFPLKYDANGWSRSLPNVYTIIWTTTPWTIPANLACAFHPFLEYSLVKVEGDHYLLLDALVEKVATELGWENFTKIETLMGVSLEGSSFKHPIFERDSVAVMAEYVTTEDGTGVVHTAPGHGRDDFFTGLKNKLDILCPVDERGILTKEAGEFEGVSYKDCDKVVVDRLAEVGNLLKAYDYQHSYPYAERDGKPVIFRATEQWFVGIDFNDLRDQMLAQIANVQFVPETGRNRIEPMVRNRPDWCISRQRPWGVGIPVIYGKESGEPVLDAEVIEAVAQLIENEGSDAWFEKEPAEFLPTGYKHPMTGETEFRKETDVLDVWFDSGATNLCVLEGNVEPEWKENWPADLYLEGSDQHRGWFNSSLVIATAIRGEAPYKTVLTHGFVNDEKGMKMSKRFGNVVDPNAACDTYGADILRYWAASVDWANDVPCGDNLLKQMGESYRTIRNTLRFLLGNLSDYTPGTTADLLELDQWVIEQTDLLVADCTTRYEEFDFGAALIAIHNFCVNELSRFYLDSSKDRMYCDGKDWNSRRSGQVACLYVLERLVKLIAPILCHTAEEVYERLPLAAGEKLESVHMETLPRVSRARLGEIQGSERERKFGSLLQTRAWVFAEYEKWKVGSGVKDSQDVRCAVTVSENDFAWLRQFDDEELAVLFKMSWVELSHGTPTVSFSESPFRKCERSRLRRPDVEDFNGTPLTARDRKVLEEIGFWA